MTRLVHLTAPGQPVSTQNHRRPQMVNGEIRIAKSEAASRWYGAVVPQLQAQFSKLAIPTITAPVRVDLFVYFRHDGLSESNPHIDNVTHAAVDALVKAGVIADGRLIQRGWYEKLQDERNPRIEIDILTGQEAAA